MIDAVKHQQPRRVSLLVDGYNLYHAMDDSGRHDLKWLDLRALGNLLIAQDKDSILTDVFYFSAYATWKKEQYARHREYVKALKTRDIKIILGNFKKKDRHCNNCRSTWVTHEEKESDVNIAIQLINMVHRKECDKILVISGDTDLAPAVRLAKAIAPSVHITIVLPPRRQMVTSLISAADSKQSISIDMLQRCLFSQYVRDAGNNVICERPEKYMPAAQPASVSV